MNINGAESALLGSVLVDGGLLLTVTNLVGPEDFASDAHRAVFEACRSLAGRNEGVDLVTVEHELTRTGRLERAGGAAYLAGLVDVVPDVENVETYARQVRETALSRRAALAFRRGAEALEGGTAPEGVLPTLEAALTSLRRTAGPAEDDAPIVTRPDEVLRLEGYAGPRFPTGLPGLDDLLGGGLAPGFTFCAVGAPGVGKTTLLAAWATRLAEEHGATVVMLCGDEDRTGLAVRVAQNLGFEHDEVSSAYPSTLDSLGKRLESVNVHLLPWGDRPARLESVGPFLERVRPPGGLAVVLVDSLQTVGTAEADGAASEPASVMAKVDAVRRLKKETGAVVLIASEANRGSYASRDPNQRTRGLAAGAGSRGIEFRFDVPMFLEDLGEGRTRLEVTKNRLGHRKGSTDLVLDSERARFLEIDRREAERATEAREIARREAEDRELLGRFLEAVRAQKTPLRRGELRARLRVRNEVFLRAASRAVDDGLVVEVPILGAGRPGTGYRPKGDAGGPS